MSGDPFVLFESPEGGAIGEALAARACSPASAAIPSPVAIGAPHAEFPYETAIRLGGNAIDRAELERRLQDL